MVIMYLLNHMDPFPIVLEENQKQNMFLSISILKMIAERYTNADLKISLYIQIYIKIIPRKFCIFNRTNSRVIHL